MSKLRELTIEEVSLVDEGANREARIVLRKSEKGLEALSKMVSELTQKLEEASKRVEREEYLKTARKYELLGQDAQELAEQLQTAKREAPELYEGAIKVLDAALAAVEKSGTFAELGREGYARESNDLAQIEKMAEKLCREDSTLSMRRARDRAFLANPQLQFK